MNEHRQDFLRKASYGADAVDPLNMRNQQEGSSGTFIPYLIMTVSDSQSLFLSEPAQSEGASCRQGRCRT